MLRRALAGLVVCFAVMGVAIADEVKGVLKKVDPAKRTITVTVDGTDKNFVVAQDAEVYSQAAGKKNKQAPKVPIPGGVDGIKTGSALVLSTIKKGDRETAIAIKVEGAAKKKNKQ